MNTWSIISAPASIRRLCLTIVAAMLAFIGSALFCRSEPTNQMDHAGASPSAPWKASQIIEPEALNKSLSAPTGEKPLVLCVGFPILYQGGHIVGAKFAGPTAKPEGMKALKRAVQDLPHDKQIVIYCGCCPWTKCPNIRPAFRALEDWGYTNIKVLSLPTDFRQDWVTKGFPIEKGTEAK